MVEPLAVTQSSGLPGDATSNQLPSLAGVKRKKSRVYIPVDEEAVAILSFSRGVRDRCHSLHDANMHPTRMST